MRIPQRSIARIFATLCLLAAPFTIHAQDPTEAPPSSHSILVVTGKGVQIYACEQTSSGPQWVFKAPDANLYDKSGAIVGSHGAGPSWRSRDSSSVKGELLQKKSSPDPGAIPWLLLKATSTDGSGVMKRVDFIRRSDTHGGIAPTTGCDTQHLSATTRVDYSATYTFYSAKP